jgi:oligopeptide transport system substrate-binding protein
MVSLADGILPPGMQAFNDNLYGIPFDPSRALESITRSSYQSVENLPPITITIAGYGGQVSYDIETIIVDWQQNLGVDVNIRQIEPERFLYNLKEEKDNLFFSGWIADYAHPHNFLEVLFGSKSIGNISGYENSVVDGLLLKAATETDTSKSIDIYREAEQILVDDIACIPLFFPKAYYLIKPYVQGYEITPLGLVDLRKVRIEHPHNN